MDLSVLHRGARTGSWDQLHQSRANGKRCVPGASSGTTSGTNPQQGQTPQGAFTDAVQTALWAAGPDTRVGSTFDIEVTVTPPIGIYHR